jgi:hypothetical protein
MPQDAHLPRFAGRLLVYGKLDVGFRKDYCKSPIFRVIQSASNEVP